MTADSWQASQCQSFLDPWFCLLILSGIQITKLLPKVLKKRVRCSRPNCRPARTGDPTADPTYSRPIFKHFKEQNLQAHMTADSWHASQCQSFLDPWFCLVLLPKSSKNQPQVMTEYCLVFIFTCRLSQRFIKGRLLTTRAKVNFYHRVNWVDRLAFLYVAAQPLEKSGINISM